MTETDVTRAAPPQGYDATERGAALFDRSQASKIELAGPDARLFLHNLCSQDVKDLREGAGAETFLTTAKARVVAHGVVNHVRWQGTNVLWLDTDPGQAERVLQHLNHFLISEQVELADRTGELALLRLAGPAAATILSKALATAAPELARWHHVIAPLDGREIVVRRQAALSLPGFDLWCAVAAGSVLRQRLIDAGAKFAAEATHEILRVEAGWPAFGRDVDENRFVAEIGRAAQAISYTKGCYLGQEPIVMARDRGQVNRMFMGLLCGAGAVLAPGTKLFHGDTEVGQVTSSVISPRLGQAIALAYVRRGNQEPGTALAIETAGGRQVLVCALPFAGAGVVK